MNTLGGVSIASSMDGKSIRHPEEQRPVDGENLHAVRHGFLIGQGNVVRGGLFLFAGNASVDARQLAHAAHEQQGSQHDPGIYGYGQIEDHRQREGQDHHRPVGLRPLENMPHRPQIAHVIGDHDQHGGEGRQRDVFGQRQKPHDHHDEEQGVHDGGDGRMRTGAHVGRRAGNGARGGETAEEHRGHVADTLRNQLHIRIVPVARHAVRHHTGQQRLDARSINVDIRVLSATNIDLETSLAQGRLRRDLFYRLASVTLRLPPLRDRQSDIPILVDYYIKQFSKSWLIEPPHLSASVLGALCNHDWPGNIRELRNVVSRLLLHSLDGAVTEALVRETLHEWDNISGQTAKPAQLLSLSAPAEIPLQASSRGNDTDLPSLEENERAHILEALRLTGGRLSGPRGAAALLKVPRSTLQHRIRKLGIVVSATRTSDA